MTPVLLVPPSERPLGGGLHADLRLGIGAEPTILAPGLRLGGYVISGRFAALALATGRVTLPLGPFAPFLVGGFGEGWLTNPSESGATFALGGGMMVHLARFLAFGLEATYEVVTGTDLKMYAFGPSIVISP
jgi:hypothetical protein